MAPVYLLGAGFSRAISDRMPMMNDLSTAVRDVLMDRNIPGADTAVASDFERWLNYLLERPPWLSTSEQENNRAAFFAVSQAVHEVLIERQGEAVDQAECPDWLRRLVVFWQKNDATILTFNYDNLVELAWRMYAASGGPAPDPENGNQPYADGSQQARPWTDLYPMPTPVAHTRFAPIPRYLPPETGMKLLKLHGSLTWRYTGPDGAPGDLIYETAGLPNVPFNWKADALISPPDLRKYFTDLDPMIVPPAAVKSPYYRNKILQANWKMAAEKLAGTEELVIMGFSLPPTDLIVSSPLATTCRDDIRLTPVNRDPEIVNRVSAALQIPPGQVSADFADAAVADPIQAWVNANT